MSIKLPEYGYTPKNFNKLVDITGMSNVRFMKQFGLEHPSFYKYRSGDRSMAYKTWKRLFEEVQSYLNNQTRTKVAFSSKGLSPVSFSIENIKPVIRKVKKSGAVVDLNVSYDGGETVITGKVEYDELSKSYELFVKKHQGVDAVKNVILEVLDVDLKKASNAEFLLDIDRSSSSIHSTIVSDVETVIHSKKRKS